MRRKDQPSRSSSRSAGSDPRQRSAEHPGRAVSYPRFLGLSVLGVLIPGSGLIAAGRRRTGLAILTAFLLGVAAVVAYAVRAEDDTLFRLGVSSERINMIGFGLLGVAVVWLLIAVISFFLLEPRGLGTTRRILAILLVVIAASAVVAPMGVGSRYAFTQRDFIESVFPDEREQHSLTIPDESTDEDPWAGRDRVNVLLLGSDAGDGRDGVRTDTIMVASVNAQTGDTALFSLPRNLQYTPFPEGPLRDAYPNGFRGTPESAYWLSSIYRNVPPQFPEYFEGIEDKGAEAVKLAVGEALGLDIDYYVMVNLDGFEAIVDALGGVVVDVPYRIPIGTKSTNWGTCTEPRGWIEAGEQQRLNGGEALWFARARCGPPPIDDDYERMRRQRCMVGAIAEQANPFNLLTRYMQVESAVRENVTTDIRRQRLEDFADLALRVQDAQIRSLPFTDEIVDYHEPDFELIQQFVQDSLEPSDTADDGAAGDSTAGTAQPDATVEEDATANPDDDAATSEEGSAGAQSIDDVC